MFFLVLSEFIWYNRVGVRERRTSILYHAHKNGAVY